MEVLIKTSRAAVEQYVRAGVERAAGVALDPIVREKAAELAHEIGRAWRRNGGPLPA